MSTTLSMLSRVLPSRRPCAFAIHVSRRRAGIAHCLLMLSVEIYLATYALGDFKISLLQDGPPRSWRISAFYRQTLPVLWKSTVHRSAALTGFSHRCRNLGNFGMLLIMVISAVRNTIRLYREEPIPVGKPLPNSQETRLPFSAPPSRHHRESSL